jgi:hypothetical protein
MKVLAVFVYSLFCAERFGRRSCLLVGAAVNMVCVLYITIYLGVLAPKHNTAGGWVAVVCLFIFAIGYGIGWAPVSYGLNAEVFPNAYRSKLMSITFSMQYLANFLLTRFFPNMVSQGMLVVFLDLLVTNFCIINSSGCQHWVFWSLRDLCCGIGGHHRLHLPGSSW